MISSKRARLSEAAKAKAAETTKRWKLEHRERVLEMRKAHYRANCKNAEKKAKAAAQQRRWRERRHAHILEVKNAYYVANRERLLANQKTRKDVTNRQRRERYKSDATKTQARNAKWRRNNSAKVTAMRRAYQKKRVSSDPTFKLMRNLRRRVLSTLKMYASVKVKTNHTFALIGCTPAFCRAHLESLFEEGMSWENHGIHGWHIDHKIPLASFDLTDHAQQRLAFHYTNLQPLWWRVNLSKGSKVTSSSQLSHRPLRPDPSY